MPAARTTTQAHSEALLRRLPRAPPLARCYTFAPPSSTVRESPMNWILPVSLVVLAALVIAAAHFLFVRWMQRASEPAPIPEQDEANDQ